MSGGEQTVFSIRVTSTLEGRVNGEVRSGRNVEVALTYDALVSGWLARFASDRQGKGALAVLVALSLHCRHLEGEDFRQLEELGLVSREDKGTLFCRVTDVGLADELGVGRKAVGRAVDWLAEQEIIRVLEIPKAARDEQGFYRDSRGQFKGDAIYLLAADGVLTTQERSEPVGDDAPPPEGYDGPRSVGDDVPPTVGDDDPRVTPAVGDDGPRSEGQGATGAGLRKATVGRDDPPTVGDDDAQRTYLPTENKEEDTACAPARVPIRVRGQMGADALRFEVPVQPSGLDDDEAFNLALDRALALLPERLRNAEAALYTLAAEIHASAVRCPSSAWPDAGGAGWVLDAIQDALAADQRVTVRLIRAIVDRWRAQGNPYARSVGGRGDGRCLGEGPEELVTPPGEGVGEVADGDLSGENALLRRQSESCHDTASHRDSLRDPESDSDCQADRVLAQVTAWYRRSISAQITPMTADELGALAQEQRDLHVWEYAFERAKHISGEVGRWGYVRRVVLDPDREAVQGWLDSGKQAFPVRRAKGDDDGSKHQGARATRQRRSSSRGGRRTRDYAYSRADLPTEAVG